MSILRYFSKERPEPKSPILPSTSDPAFQRVSERKGLYVQATHKGYIWTRKAQK